MGHAAWLTCAGSALVFSVSLAGAQAPPGPVLYENDFEGSVGSEWSLGRTDTSPLLGRRFLGQFQTEPLSLTLHDLPVHAEITVDFDLYAIGAWDGNQPGPGPSLWEISVDGGPTLLRTTFSNIDGHAGLHFNQSYPMPYPQGDNAPYTGAAERNTMGFTYAGDRMDAVYKMSFAFPHAASSLRLNFWSSLEYYGIDNIVISSTPTFSAEIVPASPHCVDVVVASGEPFRGGELGLAYDPSIVSAVSVGPGADFPEDGEIHARLDPENHCSGESSDAAGFTVGWLNSLVGDSLTEPGRHRMLRVCFELADGMPIGSCSPLSFVECLGPVSAPSRNVITDSTGRSKQLAISDGSVCIQPELALRRGDANGDGAFDISDAIFTLGCLFVGTECPECPDAADANDDAQVNIADPVYLLNWRFSAGTPPAEPFVSCGLDPTEDALPECGKYAPCP